MRKKAITSHNFDFHDVVGNDGHRQEQHIRVPRITPQLNLEGCSAWCSWAGIKFLPLRHRATHTNSLSSVIAQQLHGSHAGKAVYILVLHVIALRDA